MAFVASSVVLVPEELIKQRLQMVRELLQQMYSAFL
jgi:hypothetical protein